MLDRPSSRSTTNETKLDRKKITIVKSRLVGAIVGVLKDRQEAWIADGSSRFVSNISFGLSRLSMGIIDYSIAIVHGIVKVGKLKSLGTVLKRQDAKTLVAQPSLRDSPKALKSLFSIRRSLPVGNWSNLIVLAPGARVAFREARVAANKVHI